MAHLKRPDVMHTLLEGRAILELGASTLALPWLLRAPKGTRHGIMVLPGFLAGDTSTAVLRRFLKIKGYHAEGWKLGRNSGQHLEDSPRLVSKTLLERVLNFYRDTQGPVTLIGWSLGGIMAREVARLMPEQIRQVITLGSPFQGPQVAAPIASKMFRFMNRKRLNKDFVMPEQFRERIHVPCTAIYSRSDGIAHWHGCRHHDIQPGELAEDIEVKTSHFGYGHHPGVLWLIARRLALPIDPWQPIAADHLPDWLYPQKNL
jgi:hypothetical protein